MSNELMVGVELFFSGMIMVFVVLFIFKTIMDLMARVANRPPRGAPLDLTEEELAAVMAVMKNKLPGICEADMKFTLIKGQN